jgi:hypothetical protein
VNAALKRIVIKARLGVRFMESSFARFSLSRKRRQRERRRDALLRWQYIR